ncbi:MAG: hypothetical protein BWK79_16180 [Beggiatoa sp. IS2]|nr:MAG: hypothetical protein BWK79_16180 [Beggiatoa sp. IS2]
MTFAGRIFMIIWVTAIFILAATVWNFVVSTVYQNKIIATERHLARIDSNVVESGKTEPEQSPPPGHENDVPVEVRVGIYVDRIVETSIRESNWTVDFYIWFNWTDETINPGETFQVIDGKIESKDKLKETIGGQEHYALYRVVSQITKFFDVSRFPCDDHLLAISIEDIANQSYQLRYVADEQNSNISSRVKVQGYEIHRKGMTVKPHSYKTTRGDPSVPADYKATYSQFVLGIWVARSGFGFYFKIFLGLFVAVAVAMVTFFIKPTNVDPRFGLSVGGLFTAVANTYITSTLLPDTGIMTLTDMVNSIGMGMIFLTIIQSAISLHFLQQEENETLSWIFDKVSFIIFLTVYIIINLAIPTAAFLR